jgi:hypothetical protein
VEENDCRREARPEQNKTFSSFGVVHNIIAAPAPVTNKWYFFFFFFEGCGF